MVDSGNTEQRIKERAYAIWERAGQPDGQAGEHWAEAEREIRNEQEHSSGPAPGEATGNADAPTRSTAGQPE